VSLPPLPAELAQHDGGKAFRDQLAKELATGPLYRKVSFGGQLVEPGRYIRPPDEIRLVCSNAECERENIWDLMGPHVISLDRSAAIVAYHCRHCRESRVEYFIHVEIILDGQKIAGGHLTKAGQYPPLDPTVPPHVKLSETDLDLYRKALRNRNSGFGLGGLAYLRRVVEDEMNGLIDRAAEACRAQGGQVNESDLAQAKRASYEEKAKLAQIFLPLRIQRYGQNPFGLLCDFASEGVHAKSENECVDYFDKIRDVFERLFEDLEYEMTRDVEFGKALGALARKKGEYTEKPAKEQ
jgi:hypothetical protein